MINIALRLPIAEIEALLQGIIIAILSNKFITPGREFALVPTDASINLVPVEQYYRSSFLPIAQSAFSQLNSQGILLQPQQISLFPNNEQLQLPLLAHETVLIQAWARCELCQILDNPELLAALSKLTIWTKKGLETIVAQRKNQRKNIFLAYVRVYELPKSIEVAVNLNSEFVHLPQELRVSEATPVLTDRIFAQRKRQLENLEPPLHPELEELQSALASLSITNPAAKELDDDIKVFLGWSSDKLIKQPDPNLAWINDIAKLGDRSIEKDEGKTNYQAGTDFENIVRKSLEFLGFTVDYFHKGGAGGVDVFCSQPYPLVGECKAGKKIPNDTAVQLLNLGTLRLKNQELFKQATKLIIGPGKPTTQLQDAAKIQDMAIINPETLEKLVRLQSIYRNSIDLFKLKEYLKAGQSDDEVEKYIDQVYKEMSLRSQIIKVVKELSEQDNQISQATHPCFTVTEIRAHYNATHNRKQTDDQVGELLIELSSPLTGYLGREKGDNWRSDRFYFLRDLPIN